MDISFILATAFVAGFVYFIVRRRAKRRGRTVTSYARERLEAVRKFIQER